MVVAAQDRGFSQAHPNVATRWPGRDRRPPTRFQIRKGRAARPLMEAKILSYLERVERERGDSPPTPRNGPRRR